MHLCERLLFRVSGNHVPIEQAEVKCLNWLVEHENNYGDFDYAEQYFSPILALLRERAEARELARANRPKPTAIPIPGSEKVKTKLEGNPYLKKEAKMQFEALVAILETPVEQVCLRAASHCPDTYAYACFRARTALTVACPMPAPCFPRSHTAHTVITLMPRNALVPIAGAGGARVRGENPAADGPQRHAPGPRLRPPEGARGEPGGGAAA